jgi:hypothetical protein
METPDRVQELIDEGMQFDREIVFKYLIEMRLQNAKNLSEAEDEIVKFKNKIQEYLIISKYAYESEIKKAYDKKARSTAQMIINRENFIKDLISKNEYLDQVKQDL